MIRVGINGMGRVGRAYLRLAEGSPDLEVMVVNDIADIATRARLVRRDGTSGALPADVQVSGTSCS